MGELERIEDQLRQGALLGQACASATAVLTPALRYLRLLLLGTNG